MFQFNPFFFTSISDSKEGQTQHEASTAGSTARRQDDAERRRNKSPLLWTNVQRKFQPILYIPVSIKSQRQCQRLRQKDKTPTHEKKNKKKTKKENSATDCPQQRSLPPLSIQDSGSLP